MTRSTIVKTSRRVTRRYISGDTIIRNFGKHTHNILIGIATLGVIRYEWHLQRQAQIIPINWSANTVTGQVAPPSLGALSYQIADAQNVMATEALTKDYEWLLLWEDDVLPPFDALMRLSHHTQARKVPIVSGLYYSKSSPSWPLVFRGRGRGVYLDWAPGDTLWCDGVPTGFLLVHHSILAWFSKNAPDYRLPDGHVAKQIFRSPREAWYDPETEQYLQRMGTSDLFFCDEIRKHNVLAKTGWKRLAKERYPFMVDTKIACRQIDLQGRLYPDSVERLNPKGGDPFSVNPATTRRVVV